jgi:hypothetical protein
MSKFNKKFNFKCRQIRCACPLNKKFFSSIFNTGNINKNEFDSTEEVDEAIYAVAVLETEASPVQQKMVFGKLSHLPVKSEEVVP